MRYTTDQSHSFGHQCDALTASGERCRCRNRSVYPCYIANGIPGRSARLCQHHSKIRSKRKWDRIPLIEGGFLGGYNRYAYGSMVTTAREIDWEDPALILEIPKFWAIIVPGVAK